MGINQVSHIINATNNKSSKKSNKYTREWQAPRATIVLNGFVATSQWFYPQTFLTPSLGEGL